MKAIKTIIMSMLLLAGLTTSCTNDIDEAASQSEAYLKIDAEVDGMTRGAVDATNFTKGDAIGVFVRDLEGKDYDATVKCSNIRAIYNGSEWTLDSNVPLESGKEAVVYAYYPYNANAVITGDSIDIDITKQDDVLYGNATGVTTNNPTAKINFKHALARITLAITKGTNDVGDGKLTNIRIQNAPQYLRDHSGLIYKGISNYISFVGKMNFVDGSIKRMPDAKSNIEVSNIYMLTKEIQNIDFLTMPCGDNKVISTDVSGIKIMFTIDGKEYLYSISHPYWKSGVKYVYPISINRTTDYSNIPADKVYMGSNADDGRPLYWASYNLGATKPEDYGGLYGWGDITGSCTSQTLSDYPSANPPTDLNSSNYNLPAKKWGDGWRYPTNGEFWLLMANCNDEEYVVVNGVECVKFTSKVNGNVLYFPIAPVRIGTKVTTSQQSYYWLSKLNADDKSMAGTFYMDTYWKNAWPTAGKPRYYGLPIRPVTEVK